VFCVKSAVTAVRLAAVPKMDGKRQGDRLEDKRGKREGLCWERYDQAGIRMERSSREGEAHRKALGVVNVNRDKKHTRQGQGGLMEVAPTYENADSRLFYQALRNPVR